MELQKRQLLILEIFNVTNTYQTKKPLHGGFFVWYNRTMVKTSKGFTVLEFLIVITIIGILIAIVLVSLSSSRARARDDERIARVQNASIAI